MRKAIKEALSGTYVTDTKQPSARKRRWSLVLLSYSVYRKISLAVAAMASIILLGYLTGHEPLYRPYAGAPATNPVTAICIVAIGIAIANCCRTANNKWIRFLVYSVLLLAIIRLVDAFYGTDFIFSVTPFRAIVSADMDNELSNCMGINTAATFILIATAILSKIHNQYYLSQIMASVSILFPMISIVGYGFYISDLYGGMSPITAILELALGLSILAATARHGAIRAILSPYLVGNVVRLQTLITFVVLLLMGFLIVLTLKSSPTEDIIGSYIIFSIWFVLLLIGLGGTIYERLDRKHRAIERTLISLAMNDYLTGIPNRRQFIEFGKLEMARSKRSGAPFSMMMIDIDYFKNINDVAGHAIGDQVLIAVSGMLKNIVRSEDLVGRLGGEEFGVILVDSDYEGVKRLSKSILDNVKALEIDGWTEEHGPVTVSIGCAESSTRATFGDLMIAADNMMYQAKNKGRNTIALETYPELFTTR